MPGSLAVVGSGIQLGQVTLETKAFIEQAEKVIYLVADPVTEAWINELNPTAESLMDCYVQGRNRIESYEEMVGRIMAAVRGGKRVCAVFYGHPGVFVYPSHKAIKVARSEGYKARMLPGVSAEDCLFADVGVDPSRGCQTFEATAFLLRKLKFDTSNIVILWQIGVVGEATYNPGYDRAGLSLLLDYLGEFYPGDHEVIVYEAAQYVVCDPVIQKVKLRELPQAKITPISTLYIPPYGTRDVDGEMQAKLQRAVLGENRNVTLQSLDRG
jgi:uncharacterized protein YabN with tetrapyrrole methylase and pyrophosphatase domain